MHPRRFFLLAACVCSILPVLAGARAGLGDARATGGRTNDVCVARDGSVWAVGDSGTILKKTGLSPWLSEWKRAIVSGIVQEEWDFNGVVFMDSRLGWVVGEKDCQPDSGLGIVLKTTDSGRHWVCCVPAPPEGEAVPFDDVHFVNRNDGWIVAGEKYILKTYDGGSRWEWSWQKGDELKRFEALEH